MPSLKSIIPRLCKDFVVASFDDTPMPCVVTALNYPGGDSINVYFDKRGQRGLSITDAGTTFETIRNSGFSITDESYRVIETTCRASGVEIVGIRKHLTASVKPTTIGVDCLAFCQCLSQVAGIIFHQHEQKHSAIPRKIDRLLVSKVKPKRDFVKEWRDTEHDPEGAFPVDYHFNGQMPPRNLFYATSDSKALLVTAVSHFLRSHGEAFQTMTVIDPARVTPKQIERIQFASDELKYGVDGNESDIVRFALGAELT